MSKTLMLNKLKESNITAAEAKNYRLEYLPASKTKTLVNQNVPAIKINYFENMILKENKKREVHRSKFIIMKVRCVTLILIPCFLMIVAPL